MRVSLFYYVAYTGTYTLTSNGTKDMGVNHTYRYVSANVTTEDTYRSILSNVQIKTIAAGSNGTWSLSVTSGTRYFVSIFNGAYNSAVSDITCTGGATVISSSSMIYINGDGRRGNHKIFIVTATSSTMTFSGNANNYGSILFYSPVSSSFAGTISTTSQTSSDNKAKSLAISTTTDGIYIISVINEYYGSTGYPHGFGVTDNAIVYNSYNNGDSVITLEGSYKMYPTINIFRAKSSTVYYTKGYNYGNACTVLRLTSW